MTSGRKRGRPAFGNVSTPAEWRVVEGVRHGMTSRQIAERRGVSIDAVKYHVANALAKLGLASRAELRLWNGVAQASALDVTEPDMEVSIAAVGQISRTVADIAAARAWYQDVLGLPHQYSFGDLAFFDCGGVRLFLSQREAGNAAAAQSIICFRVDDIRGGQNLLAESGVVFINAPHLIHRHADGAEEWMAFFNDNEGRPLAVMALHRP